MPGFASMSEHFKSNFMQNIPLISYYQNNSVWFSKFEIWNFKYFVFDRWQRSIKDNMKIIHKLSITGSGGWGYNVKRLPTRSYLAFFIFSFTIIIILWWIAEFQYDLSETEFKYARILFGHCKCYYVVYAVFCEFWILYN